MKGNVYLKFNFFVVLFLLLVFSVPSTSIAASSNAFGDTVIDAASVNNMQKISTNVDEMDIELSKKEEKEFDKYNADLANQLEQAYDCGAPEKMIDNIIKRYARSDKNLLAKNLSEAIEEKIDENNENNVPPISIDADISDLSKNYPIDESHELEIAPTYIAVTNNISEDNETNMSIASVLFTEVKAAEKSKTAHAVKTYYAIGFGYKLFKVSVGGTFKYDGKKAKYKANAEAYYKQYIGGALYSVKNWSGVKRESNGTSYQFWCSGNFREGIAIKGNGLIWIDYYIKHRVKCSKNGKINKYYTCK